MPILRVTESMSLLQRVLASMMNTLMAAITDDGINCNGEGEGHH